MKRMLMLLLLLLSIVEIESDTVIFQSGKTLENVKAKLRESQVDILDSWNVKKTYAKKEIKSIIYKDVVNPKQPEQQKDADGTSIYVHGNKTWGKIKSSAGWIKANTLCKSKNMRLPSSKELSVLYKSNVSWRKEGCPSPCTYWALEFDSESAHSFSMQNGSDNILLKSISKNVLCVKE